MPCSAHIAAACALAKQDPWSTDVWKTLDGIEADFFHGLEGGCVTAHDGDDRTRCADDSAGSAAGMGIRCR